MIVRAAAETLGDVSSLPFSLKVLLENLLRWEDDRTVNVEFTFIEGQVAKLNDVQISGNTKTRDAVIRRADA